MCSDSHKPGESKDPKVGRGPEHSTGITWSVCRAEPRRPWISPVFESCSPRRHRERVWLGKGCGSELPVGFQLRLLHGSDQLPPQPAVTHVSHFLSTLAAGNATMEQRAGLGWRWGAPMGSCCHRLSWLLPLRQHQQGSIGAGTAVLPCTLLHTCMCRAQLQRREPLAPCDAGHPPASASPGCPSWVLPWGSTTSLRALSTPLLPAEEKVLLRLCLWEPPPNLARGH